MWVKFGKLVEADFKNWHKPDDRNKNLKIQIFWDMMLCWFVNSYRCFSRACYLHLRGLSQTHHKLHRLSAGSSKISVTVYQSTWHHTLEVFNLHKYWCEDLKYCNKEFIFIPPYSSLYSSPHTNSQDKVPMNNKTGNVHINITLGHIHVTIVAVEKQ
jgi:hypothetical protein